MSQVSRQGERKVSPIATVIRDDLNPRLSFFVVKRILNIDLSSSEN